MRATLLFLSLFVSASESAEPVPVPDHTETLQKAFSYFLGRSDDKSAFAADADFKCAQECVDADWCPCTKDDYSPEEFRAAMASFREKEDLKDIEMRVFLDKDRKHAYVRGSVEIGGKQRHFFDIITFDDVGKISKGKNSLPYKLSPEQLKMFQKSWKYFKKGDISSMMKLYAQDMEFHCDKACVVADWCSCKKPDYNFDEISKWAQSVVAKNFTQFKDLTINGQPMSSRMNDAVAMKNMELYFVDKTFFMPYNVGGMFNSTKVPCTPMLEMFSLNENKKIARGSLMTGVVVKPLRNLR